MVQAECPICPLSWACLAAVVAEEMAEGNDTESRNIERSTNRSSGMADMMKNMMSAMGGGGGAGGPAGYA